MIEAAGSGVTLEQVLLELSRSTGVVFSFNEQTRTLLSQTKVALSSRASIEPADAYPWVESLLVQHGFWLGSPSSAQPPMVQVVSLVHASGVNSPAALVIEESELAFCREHPAVLVAVTLALPHLDVRTLANSMRGITPSHGPTGFMPVGNTNSVLLTGSGGWIDQMAALLQRVDAVAATGQDPHGVFAAEAAKLAK